MNNILKAVKPKEIRKKMLIASYDLTKNTSICPAQDMRNMINNRILYGEVENPDLSNLKPFDQWGRIFTIDKSREVIKLFNITVENKIVNIETQEEIKVDYVYNENHFIRLIVHADVEITNEELAKECDITLDNIQFATRSIVEHRKDMDILNYILTWDAAKYLDMDKRLKIKDISFDGYKH